MKKRHLKKWTKKNLGLAKDNDYPKRNVDIKNGGFINQGTIQRAYDLIKNSKVEIYQDEYGHLRSRYI